MANEDAQLEVQFIEQVHQHCGLEVNVDPHMLGLYATDASIYQVSPIGVVTPESIGQIPELLRICSEFNVPVIPRGGGTSLAGQCVNRAVVIDVSRGCHGLQSVDIPAGSCRVESGMTVDDLNDGLVEHGVFFAPDPSTSRQANIGGCIGNNAAGVHSVLYGRTSDNVLEIDASLADGTRVVFAKGSSKRDPVVRDITDRVIEVIGRNTEQIRERFPKTMRRSSGYQLDVILDQLDESDWDPDQVNLAPLLCGSEGTLAVTLGATLELREIPKCKGLAVMAFETLDEAIAAVAPSLTLNPSGVELLDDLIMDLARGNTECSKYVNLLPNSDAKAVLFVEFFAESLDSINASFERLREILPAVSITTSTDQIEMEHAWKLRKAGEPLLHAIEGNRKPLGFVEDNAVPVENLAEFVSRFREIVTREGTIASYYAHASVGVLHVRPLLDLRDPEDEKAMHRIASAVADLAQELGGVPSGEHGDGRARGPFVESYFGSELLTAFREIKAIFDPKNLLNPGNIIEPAPIESISEHTRIKPNTDLVEFPDIETYYRYEPEHGFGHAVEMCNGAGVCRRKHGGVMCPSYQSTLDERHSTRGRGNALRLAITGQVNLVGTNSSGALFDDQGTKDTLDLCLSCKGCKSECPSSVDISKLKSEFLAQGYQSAGRTPVSVRIMSNIHRVNKLGSQFPQLTNMMNSIPPVRSLINHALKIHPKRALPKMHPPVRRRDISQSTKPKVVLLSDTFTTHNDPSIARASVRVLEAFGYDVGIETVSDFGRAAISLGNLEFAINDAQRTLDQLKHLIDDDEIVAFVIPEPSCLSAAADDWTDLNLNRDVDLVNKFKSKAALPEAFIESWWDRHPTTPDFGSLDGRIMIHGHCHQKALWGDITSSAIFERLYPGMVDVLETGCCGMAGSFGYADHRYDLSMKIGEQALFPAVRRASMQDIIVAPGTSCRHQISDGTSRKSLHPIEALAQLLSDE
jgi:FAD/FMN-containing dehydrogenase/Fe-S oxidoreductase